MRSLYRTLTLPAVPFFLLRNEQLHPAYRMSYLRRLRLALRMRRNTKHINTGTSYRAHLAMTAKLLSIPPEVEGDVVECGCFLGGSTANLSLACEIAGRNLIVYDSFEGMPPAQPGDIYATPEAEGWLRGDLEVVQDNVRRYGAIGVCSFRKGWFEDTLPSDHGPVVLCFLDVDYQASLRDCVLNLWPRLTEQGYVFIDEYLLVDYCSLFYSERFWRESFDSVPPGLLGAGSGIGVGDFYLGPRSDGPAFHGPGSIAYTRRDLTGFWDFYPETAKATTEVEA